MKNIKYLIVLATSSVGLIGMGEAYRKPDVNEQSSVKNNQHRAASPDSIAFNKHQEENNIDKQQNPQNNATPRPYVKREPIVGYFDEHGNGYDSLPVGEYNPAPVARPADTPSERRVDSSQESSLFSRNRFADQLAPTRPQSAQSTMEENSESNAATAKASTRVQPKVRVVQGGYSYPDGKFSDGSELGLPPVDSLVQQ